MTRNVTSARASLVVAGVSALLVARTAHDGDVSVDVPRNAYGAAIATVPDTLRVCSDPNNLPFSNAARGGFENRIADRIAADMHIPLAYTWWVERRGFVRSTVNSGLCDVVMGVPTNIGTLITTRAYYRSTYTFVSRQDRHLDIHSFDDPRLKHLKIGVQLIGDDFANTPPAHALAARGMTRNLTGYTVYGDSRDAEAPARIVKAVENRAIDIAVVWGPLAGYAAKRSTVALDIVPVLPRIDAPYLPFVFDIAMGLRRGDTTFRARLDEAVAHERPAIDSILETFSVPRLDFVSSARAGASVR